MAEMNLMHIVHIKWIGITWQPRLQALGLRERSRRALVPYCFKLVHKSSVDMWWHDMRQWQRSWGYCG